MSFDVTVAVATYGDGEWVEMARTRALPSALALGVPVVYEHGESLHEARNAALARVDTEWVIHLDADDELEPGFVDALARGSADVRAPSVRYVKPNGRSFDPYVPRVAGHQHDCTADCLPDGNWLVCGSAVRAQMLRDIGGWRDFPWSEDWDVWLRCWKAGATFEAIPDAVYRAFVNRQSRNRAPDQAFRNEAHRAIHRANFPELYDEEAA